LDKDCDEKSHDPRKAKANGYDAHDPTKLCEHLALPLNAARYSNMPTPFRFTEPAPP
jgi:hypothetical protein